MKNRAKILALSALLTALAASPLPAGAQDVPSVLPSVPQEIQAVEHVYNVPNASGNSLAFCARAQADGTERWYAVVSTIGNGFDILDVTNPEHPVTVGRYILGEDPVEDQQGAVMRSSLGVNFHPWVDVNTGCEVVSLTIEDPGIAPRQGIAAGLMLVDVEDLTDPKPIGIVPGNTLGGPHTNKMVGDHCVYTSLGAWIVDYSDPQNLRAKPVPPAFAGHEYFEDPNVPNRTYVGTQTAGKWAIIDTTDCYNPVLVSSFIDTAVQTAHEVYPAPDSSIVGVADFTTPGQLQTQCPGGAVHFYDISGKYVPGASVDNPRKLDARYFAPFTGLPVNGNVNYGSCTMHSWRPDLERMLGLGGLYMGGTFVFDWSSPTVAGGGVVPEYDRPAPQGRGKTTWGNTKGLVRDVADYVNASQWLPFNLMNPAHERLFYVVGSGRGLDVYRFTGALPKKLARLQVAPSATGGVVTGSLDRYARLTVTGYENFPLPGEPVDVTAGGKTMTVVTADDGSYSANLALEPGTHLVTVTWTGDDTFRGETATATVSV